MTFLNGFTKMEDDKMFNIYNKKNQKTATIILAIVLILSMVVPLIVSAF